MNYKKIFVLGTIFMVGQLGLDGRQVDQKLETTSVQQPTGEEIQQPAVNKKVDAELRLPLERIDPARIKGYEEAARKQFKRFALLNKLFYVSAGVTIVGGGLFLWWFLSRSDDSANDVVPSIDKTRLDAFQLEFFRERLQQKKDKATVLGCAKWGAKDAIRNSIYSFMMFLFFEQFSHLGGYVNSQIAGLIGKGPEELLKNCEEVTKKTVCSLTEVIDEYTGVCKDIVENNLNADVAFDHKCFLDSDMKNQHAALIGVFEELIAFFSVLLENKKNAICNASVDFDKQMTSIINFVGRYTDDLQTFLNMPDNAEKVIIGQKMSLLTRQLFLRVTRFMQKSSELIAW